MGSLLELKRTPPLTLLLYTLLKWSCTSPVPCIMHQNHHRIKTFLSFLSSAPQLPDIRASASHRPGELPKTQQSPSRGGWACAWIDLVEHILEFPRKITFYFKIKLKLSVSNMLSLNSKGLQRTACLGINFQKVCVLGW